MFLFSLVFLPAVLIFCLWRAQDRVVISVAFFGAFTGILICILLTVFSFMHRVPEYSFVINLIYFITHQYVFPIVVLYLIYFFGTKDEMVFRLKSFFTLSAGFFSIYMPYCIVSSSSSAFSFYTLFIKPVIVLSMLVYASKFLLVCVQDGLSGHGFKAFFNGLMILVTIAIPPLLETIWILKIYQGVLYIVASLYAILASLVFFNAAYKRTSFLL